MKHKKYVKLISQWIDGELAASEAELLQSHLQHCVACQHQLATMQKLHHLFEHNAKFVAKPFFAARVMAIAKQRKAAGFWNMFDFIPRPVIGTAIALTVIIFSIVSFSIPIDNSNASESSLYPYVSNSSAPNVETYDDALEFAYLNEYAGD